jgi:tetratricopeptide (TPR) repeat protein
MAGATQTLENAMAAHRRGDEAAAAGGYRAVLARQPENADALHLLGVIVARTEPEAGIALIARALTANPDSVEAHVNIAGIFAARFRMVEAEHHFRQAYQRARKNIMAAAGLGGALLHLGRYQEAEELLREALKLDPTAAPVLINLGSLMDARGRFDEGLQFYERVIALYPDNAMAHQHKAIALLMRGQCSEGWAEYVWRLKLNQTFHGRFPLPYWRGEPLTGRKILVWTEMGPGDEILTSTMIPDLLARGAKIVLLCSPRMAPIFARSFPGIFVLAAGQQPSDPAAAEGLAFQASIGDLGAVLRPSFDAFQAKPALLKADQERTAALRDRYKAAAPGTLLVGLSWRSRNVKVDEAKSVPLRAWRPVLTQPGVTFVNLQYGDTAGERADVECEMGVSLLTDSHVDPLADLDAFAAQVAAMDVVISTSNTTVHMAGALGRPTWALVPSNHGRLWYWFLERSDSPWYPSARLFRQDHELGWQPALAAVADHLAKSRGATT